MRNVRTADVKKSPKVKKYGKGINKYFESRRERTYGGESPFDRTITPDGFSNEKKAEGSVLRRGHIDVRFLTYAAALLCFGAVMSYSASCVYAEQKYGDGSYFIVRYLVFALAAIAFTLPFALISPANIWKRLAFPAYVASIVLLLLVIFVGSDGGGAQRWLNLGFITVQPSELAKTAVVMMLALYMTRYDKHICEPRSNGESFKYGVIFPTLIFGTVCALVALEKHISGLMIIGMIGISVMYMGGTRVKWIFGIICLIAVAGCALILVSDYARERVNTWINIDSVDPLGSAWQTLQGLYAIGSGGLFGVGLGNSRQKHGYVSQPQNDFIFTIICEELGFLGAFLVIALFALLVIRGFKIAARASDKFNSLLAFGLTFKLALQVILNIAVVTNSMPNTGISLPFFSSGGTSLALQIFEMGIILSISRYSTVRK